MPLGTLAPDFNLPNTDGETTSLNNFKDKKALVVIFMCNHCPFVKHVRSKLAEIAQEYQQQGIAFVGISSNDVDNYPDDSFELMKKEAEKANYTFPYLYDETQQTAKAYQAACTPDLFVFDKNHKLAYRGQFDNTRPYSFKKATGKDLKQVMDDLLADREVSIPQKQSAGCNIKWKPGNEPDYSE